VKNLSSPFFLHILQSTKFNDLTSYEEITMHGSVIDVFKHYTGDGIHNAYDPL
jgi:hypothetical protein